MTKKYIYIHSEGNPSRVTSFFIVMLGNSHRDVMRKRIIEGQVIRYGDYFRPYDAEQWEFIKKCVKSIFDNDDMVTLAQQIVKVTPDALITYLRGGDVPRNPISVVHNAIKVQCQMSVDYRISTARRKNVKNQK